ncbi:hypothetical protein D1007_21802 [Hordeum vulgare]|nr:hypothetical protein D1007_21802 [Hordeum vulgare]
MANFELDPEFFLPSGHNIIAGGPDRLPRTYTTPAVPITRRPERFVIADVHPAPPTDNLVQPPAAADRGGWEPKAAPEAPPADPVQDQESMVIDQPSPSSSDSVHELVDLDPQPQGDIEAEAADLAPPAPNLDVVMAADPTAPNADMAPVVQARAAEPEEDVQGEDEA